MFLKYGTIYLWFTLEIYNLESFIHFNKMFDTLKVRVKEGQTETMGVKEGGRMT